MFLPAPALFAGLLAGFESLSYRVTGFLVAAFQTPLVALQAGLEKVMQSLMESIGKIPKIGEMLGLSGFKAESIEAIQAKIKESGGARVLGGNVTDYRDLADKKGAESLQILGDALKPVIDAFQEINRVNIDGMKSAHPANIFNTEEPRAALKKLQTSLGTATEKIEGNGNAHALVASNSFKGVQNLLSALKPTASDNLARVGGFIGGTEDRAGVDEQKKTNILLHRNIDRIGEVVAAIRIAS